MPTQIVLPCGYCKRDRLHQVVVTRGGTAAPTTRVQFCPFCDTSKPYGLCCPRCGDIRFSTHQTRPRPDGSTARVKVCRHCRHRVRSKEVLVSAGV